MTVPTLEYKDCAPIGAFEYKSSTTTMAEYAVKSAVLDVPNPLDPADAGLGNAPVGEVQFYAAVTGVKDAVGDIIVPGAFGRTLGERLPRVCLGHDWNRPIGRTVEVKELMPGDPGLPATTATGKPWPREAGALYVKALYNLGTKDGRNAFSDAQFMGRSAMYSIGYVAKEKEQKGDTRYLHDLDLWEYGPVLHPANDLASGISAKGGEPDNLETKARHVRDADFWGLPIGTAIRPGMRPRGKVAVAMRRRGEVPDRNAGTMDRAPDPTQRAELESQQAGRSTSRAITDIRGESDGAGLFDTPQRQGTVRAARSARGADQEHLDAVHGDAEREDESTAINGRDRSDLAVHELTIQQREGLRGLLDEGITPDEVDEELPDDIDADHRASIMQAYRHAYAQRAEQQGQGGGTGRSPEVAQPQQPESFEEAARRQRGEEPVQRRTAPPADAARARAASDDAVRASAAGNPGSTPARVDDPAANRQGLAGHLERGGVGVDPERGNIPAGVGASRTVNGARTFLDRAAASAPREHHGPVQAAATMAKGMLARGTDSDPARDVRGLRRAMEHQGIDDHEMGRRLDAVDAMADAMERRGLGGVKGKGRAKPTAQAMRDYAAAGRAETGIEPETDYRHLREQDRGGGDRGNGPGGRDAGGGTPAPGSQSSNSPSADRAAAEQIAGNRGLGGGPDAVADRLAQNEQARAGMSDPGDPATAVAPERARQIADQFISRDGRRSRGTVQDAGRHTDAELEAAARDLDGRGSAGQKAAAGLRDFINYRRSAADSPAGAAQRGEDGVIRPVPAAPGAPAADPLKGGRIHNGPGGNGNGVRGIARGISRHTGRSEVYEDDEGRQALAIAARHADRNPVRDAGDRSAHVNADQDPDKVADHLDALADHLDQNGYSATPSPVADRRNGEDGTYTGDLRQMASGMRTGGDEDDESDGGDDGGDDGHEARMADAVAGLADRIRDADDDSLRDSIGQNNRMISTGGTSLPAGSRDRLIEQNRQMQAELDRRSGSNDARGRAGRAIDDGDQDALAEALADAGVPDADDRADAIMAQPGGKRRRARAAADAISSAQRNRAADDLERDTAGTPGEEAGRRNAADLRASDDELEARYGDDPAPTPDPDVETPPSAQENQTVLRARVRDAANAGTQDELADAFAAVGVDKPDDAADQVFAMRGGARARETAAAAMVMRAEQRRARTAPAVDAAAAPPERTPGDGTLSRGDLDELDALSDPDAPLGDGDPRQGSGPQAAEDFALDMEMDRDAGEPVARSRIGAYAETGDQRAFMQADNPLSPRVQARATADAALARKIALGDMTADEAHAVRADVDNPYYRAPYAAGVRPGDRLTDPDSGDPVTVHTVGLDSQGNLVLRSTAARDQRAVEIVASPGDRVERQGGDPATDGDGDPANVPVGTGEPDMRAREAAAAAEGEGDTFSAQEDAAADQGISADELDSARAEALADEDERQGMTELPDGDIEVTADVAQRQDRIEALLHRADSGRLELGRMQDAELGDTRRDLVDELALQDSMHRRNPAAYNEGRTGTEERERGGGARSRGSASADSDEQPGSELPDDIPALPRRRPGVAGAAEDYADALESGHGVEEARANLVSSLRRSGASGDGITALRAHLDDNDAADHDATVIRKHVAAMRAEQRSRRNETARQRRTAKRIERERLRSMIGQVDAEMRTRSMTPEQHGGAVADATEAQRLDAVAEAAASRSPGLYALTEDDDDRQRLADGKLINAQYRERAAAVERATNDALARGLATETLHGDGSGENWNADRAVLHQQILDDVWERKAAHVPNDGRAMFSGGLGGAGKGTILGPNNLNVDENEFFAIDPDMFKEELAKRGMVPHVDGVSPMELATLIHEESSHLAKLMTARAVRERKNIVLDNTMANGGKVAKKVRDLRDNGYGEVNAAFVEIPIETSVKRALSRHRNGVDRYNAGSGHGGRYVPPSIIRSNADPDGERSSQNIKNFEAIADEFDNWAHYDNSGSAPEFVKGKGRWSTDPRTQGDEDPNAALLDSPAGPVPTSVDDLSAAPNAPPDATPDDGSATVFGMGTDVVDDEDTGALDGPSVHEMARDGDDLSGLSVAELAAGAQNARENEQTAMRSNRRSDARQYAQAAEAIETEHRRKLPDRPDRRTLRDDEIAGLRSVGADELAPGDQVFLPSMGSTYSTRDDGTVTPRQGFAPFDGTAVTVTRREPDALYTRRGDGGEQRHDIPADDRATVLRMTPEAVGQERLRGIRRTRPALSDALGLRQNDIRAAAEAEGVTNPRESLDHPRVADHQANLRALRLLESTRDPRTNSPDSIANTLHQINANRTRRFDDDGNRVYGTDTSVGDAHANALDRLADALDREGLGSVNRPREQRQGVGIADDLREAARIYRERRDHNTPDAVEARSRAARDIRDNAAARRGDGDVIDREALGQLDVEELDRSIVERERAQAAADDDTRARQDAEYAAGRGEGDESASAEAGRRRNPETERSVRSFAGGLQEGGRSEEDQAAGRAITALADTGDPDVAATNVGGDVDREGAARSVGRLATLMRSAEPDETITDDGEPFVAKLDRLHDRLREPAPAAGQQRDADTAAARLNEHGAATPAALHEALRVPVRRMNDTDGLTPARDPQPGDMVYAPAQGRLRGAVVTGVNRNGRVTYEFSNPTSARDAIQGAIRGRGSVRDAGGAEAYRRQRADGRAAHIDQRAGHLRPNASWTQDTIDDTRRSIGEDYDAQTEHDVHAAGLGDVERDAHPGSVSRTSKPNEVFMVPGSEDGAP